MALREEYQMLLRPSCTRSGAKYAPSPQPLGSPVRIGIDLAPLAQVAAENAVVAANAGVREDIELPPSQTTAGSASTVPPTVPTPTPASSKKVKGGGRRARDKRRSKERRSSARLAELEEQRLKGLAARKVKQVALRLRRAMTKLQTEVDATFTKAPQKATRQPNKGQPETRFVKNPVASSGFVGRRLEQGGEDCRELTKAKALALGFEYVEWDGSKPRALVDKAGRVFAVLAGSPKDAADWARVNDEVQSAFEDARSSCEFKHDEHRRGKYPALTTGISFGGGQTIPTNLGQEKNNQEAVDKLLQNESIKRLAGFGNACLQLFAPRLYEYYANTMASLQANDRTLKPNFKNSVFGAATFNLGPRVATYVHTDHQNLPAGWCAVTAIGRFNPKNGGHLLLWDLNLMIEFPPGALVLIPSAILRHSNTVVGPRERRYSFTQYSAGGLFRWVECGCKTQKQFDREGGVHAITGSERWLQGIERWNVWEEM